MSSIMHKIVLALAEIYCRVQFTTPCFSAGRWQCVKGGGTQLALPLTLTSQFVFTINFTGWF